MLAETTYLSSNTGRPGTKQLGYHLSPTDAVIHKQSTWDRPGVRDLVSVESGLVTSEQKASFLAATLPHSGDWLYALFITLCGFLLVDESVRVAVSLCDWGIMFVLHKRATVTLRSMPVARMLLSARKLLVESPDIRLCTTSSQGRLCSPVSRSPRSPSGWHGRTASDPTAWR